jgi:hypothetical protein
MVSGPALNTTFSLINARGVNRNKPDDQYSAYGLEVPALVLGVSPLQFFVNLDSPLTDQSQPSGTGITLGSGPADQTGGQLYVLIQQVATAMCTNYAGFRLFTINYFTRYYKF